MQARCGLYLSFCKLACAMGATAVAAAFLAGHEDYARPSAFAAEAGIASIVMPLFVIFGFTFQIVSTVLSPVQLVLSAAVQSWCLDYKQNVVEQQLGESSSPCTRIDREPLDVARAVGASADRERDHATVEVHAA